MAAVGHGGMIEDGEADEQSFARGQSSGPCTDEIPQHAERYSEVKWLRIFCSLEASWFGIG